MTNRINPGMPHFDPSFVEELSLEELDAVHGGGERIVLSEQVSFSKADETIAFMRMSQFRTRA